MRIILLCFFFFFSVLYSKIQANKNSHERLDLSGNLLLNDWTFNSDTTNYYFYERGKNGLIIMPDSYLVPFSDNVTFRDTIVYDPAFLPVVFDGKVLPANLDFLSKDTVTEGYSLHLIPREETFAPLIDRLGQIQAQRRNYYMNMNNVRNVRYSLSQLKDVPKIDESRVTKRNVIQELISTGDPIEISPIKIEQIQPVFKYWKKSGEHSLQVAQNHISDNWYKGGNSSFFVRNYHKVKIDYSKDKLTFNNVFEWKLSLQQTPADTIHKINVSEDLVRIENTLGYKAFDHWSYSAKLETKTQLFSSYPVNSDEKNTALFAPLVVNVGLGMSYTLDKSYKDNITKKIKLTQSISPFSVNYTYIADRGVDETKFGLEQGKRSKFELGSLFNTDLTYTFNKFVDWTSRFKYFTNYHRAEIEFENKFNMSLNRYLSTNIILYLRYDDNVPKGNQYGYLQVNEMISFGLSYKW